MQSFGEAWNQAAETTGVDQVDSGTGLSFGLLLAAAEIIWWTGVAFIVKRRLLWTIETD
jgi:hypothetical protein